MKDIYFKPKLQEPQDYIYIVILFDDVNIDVEAYQGKNQKDIQQQIMDKWYFDKQQIKYLKENNQLQIIKLDNKYPQDIFRGMVM